MMNFSLMEYRIRENAEVALLLAMSSNRIAAVALLQ